MLIVYAVPFGSAFSVTICGRARFVVISGVVGAQIKPLFLGVCYYFCCWN